MDPRDTGRGQLSHLALTHDLRPTALANRLHAHLSNFARYFTSRPALKHYIRLTANFLQIARHFEVFSGADGTSTETLWEAQSVAQHHDAVSGTAKQAVTFDYAQVGLICPSSPLTPVLALGLTSAVSRPLCFFQRIAKGAAIADAALEATLAKLVTTSGDAPAFVTCPLGQRVHLRRQRQGRQPRRPRLQPLHVSANTPLASHRCYARHCHSLSIHHLSAFLGT